jgi:hypothetical protein
MMKLYRNITVALLACGLISMTAWRSYAQTTQPRSYLPLVFRDYPEPPSIFGVGLDNGTLTTGVNELIDSKSDWARLPGLDWDAVEPSEGARNWSSVAAFENEIKEITSKKINLLLVIQHTPAWAQKISGWRCGPVKSDKRAAFGRFMRDVVARYSVAPFNVKYFELWNEQDTDSPSSGVGCWGNSQDPYYGGEDYGATLKAAYQEMKAANPNAQVLIGGLLMDCDPEGSNCLSGKFFEGILRAAGSSFDGVAFHTYDFHDWNDQVMGHYVNPKWNTAWNTTGPVLSKKIQRLRSKLNQYGVSGKYFMNTEDAFIQWQLNLRACAGQSCDLGKAYYVPQVYGMAIAEGLISHVWYSMYGWYGSGLLRSDGTRTNAYQAYKFARTKLGTARFVGYIGNADVGGAANIAGYKFEVGSKRLWLVWTRDGAARDITPSPGAPTSVHDALGASQGTGSTINVTIKPLYLEW